MGSIRKLLGFIVDQLGGVSPFAAFSDGVEISVTQKWRFRVARSRPFNVSYIDSDRVVWWICGVLSVRCGGRSQFYMDR